jgi:hypothetical protein
VILRSTAVLVFAVGALGLFAGTALLGRAPGLSVETEHLRAMKDRDDPPTSVRDVDMEWFARLPHRAPMPERTRIEQQGVRMEGSVQRIELSGDGDLHLEIVTRPRTPADRDTAYVVGEITQPWRRGSRGWAYDSLLVAFRPNHGGRQPWPGGTRRVRLTGYPNYDHPYDRPVSTWLLQEGAPRRTGWEIHPVTRIEWWDERSASWRELKR